MSPSIGLKTLLLALAPALFFFPAKLHSQSACVYGAYVVRTYTCSCGTTMQLGSCASGTGGNHCGQLDFVNCGLDSTCQVGQYPKCLLDNVVKPTTNFDLNAHIKIDLPETPSTRSGCVSNPKEFQAWITQTLKMQANAANVIRKTGSSGE